MFQETYFILVIIFALMILFMKISGLGAINNLVLTSLTKLTSLFVITYSLIQLFRLWKLL